MSKQIPVRLEPEQVQELENIMKELNQATFNKTYIHLIENYRKDQEKIKKLEKQVSELASKNWQIKRHAENFNEAIKFFKKLE